MKAETQGEYDVLSAFCLHPNTHKAAMHWYKDMVSGDEQTLSIICPARSWLTLKKFHKAAKNGNFGENAHAATNLICGTGNSFLAGFRAFYDYDETNLRRFENMMTNNVSKGGSNTGSAARMMKNFSRQATIARRQGDSLIDGALSDEVKLGRAELRELRTAMHALDEAKRLSVYKGPEHAVWDVIQQMWLDADAAKKGWATYAAETKAHADRRIRLAMQDTSDRTERAAGMEPTQEHLNRISSEPTTIFEAPPTPATWKEIYNLLINNISTTDAVEQAILMKASKAYLQASTGLQQEALTKGPGETRGANSSGVPRKSASSSPAPSAASSHETTASAQPVVSPNLDPRVRQPPKDLDDGRQPLATPQRSHQYRARSHERPTPSHFHPYSPPSHQQDNVDRQQPIQYNQSLQNYPIPNQTYQYDASTYTNEQTSYYQQPTIHDQKTSVFKN